jgi:hypothetical protein
MAGLRKYGPLVLIYTLYLYLQWDYLLLDFWNDELYTLRYFVYESFRTIFTDYHVPNNHIGLNFLLRGYLLLIGEDTLFQLMDHPWRLRILPLAWAVFTIWLLYLAGREWLGATAGWIAALLLVTSLPFLNFALQIRAYGASMLCMSGILYLSLRVLYRKEHKRSLAGLALLSAMSLYLVPSNLYMLLGGLAGSAALLLKDWKKIANSRPAELVALPPLKLFSAILTGVFLGMLCYLPVFGQVFSNPYVTYEPFKWEHLQYYPREILFAFTAGRWLLVFFLLAGMLNVSFLKKHLNILLFLCILLLVPLLLVFVLGNAAPQRAFLALLPAYCLLLCFGIRSVIERSADGRSWQRALLLLILAYTTVVALLEKKQASDHVLQDLTEWRRSQDLIHQYYSFHYEPLRQVNTLQSLYHPHRDGILQLGGEDYGLPIYLEKYHLPFEKDKNPDSLLLKHDTVFILTNHPARILGRSRFTVSSLSKKPNYHNLFLCTKNYVLAEALEVNLLNSPHTRNILFQGISPALVEEKRRRHSVFLPEQASQNMGQLIHFNEQDSFVFIFKNRLDISQAVHQLQTTHKRVQRKKHAYYTIDLYKKRDLHLQAANSIILHRFDTVVAPSEETLPQGWMEATVEYSPGLEYTLSRKHPNELWCKLEFSTDSGKGGMLVFEHLRQQQQLQWHSINLEDYILESDGPQQLFTHLLPENELQAGDLLRFYVWKPGDHRLRLGRLEVYVSP